MKKVFIVFFRFLALLLVLSLGVGVGYLYGNNEELVTERMLLPKLVKSIEGDNFQFDQSFVVASENDEYLEDYRAFIEANYRHDDISELKVTIVNSSLLSLGDNQCAFDELVNDEGLISYKIRCNNSNEGVFANYLLDLKITYLENEEVQERKESALVVFYKPSKIKDMFGWRLLRYNMKSVTDFILN